MWFAQAYAYTQDKHITAATQQHIKPTPPAEVWQALSLHKSFLIRVLLALPAERAPAGGCKRLACTAAIIGAHDAA